MPSDKLTLREAAALLKKHRNVLHRWMRKGIIPFAQPGGERGRYVFSRRALLAFLQEQEKQATTPHRKRDQKPGSEPSVPIPPPPPEKQHSRVREAQRRRKQMDRAARKAAEKEAK